MRLGKRIVGFVVALAITLGTSVAAHAGGRIVYMGIDPSLHSGQTEAPILVGNAVRWAGRSANPAVAVVEGCCATSVANILTTAGLTNLTVIPNANLASTNLSGFGVLYVGTVTDATNYLSAAANVQNFVNAGGGLVTEPELIDSASWTWLPFAGLIGHSGATNIGAQAVTITDPTHPVMAGLTNAGLSNWGFSVHSDFSTPEAANFVRLTVDGAGNGHIIALEGTFIGAPAMGWPGLAGLVTFLLGVGMYSVRRRLG